MAESKFNFLLEQMELSQRSLAKELGCSRSLLEGVTFSPGISPRAFWFKHRS